MSIVWLVCTQLGTRPAIGNTIPLQQTWALEQCICCLSYSFTDILLLCDYATVSFSCVCFDIIVYRYWLTPSEHGVLDVSWRSHCI